MNLTRLLKKPEYFLNSRNLINKIFKLNKNKSQIDLIWGHKQFNINPNETIGISLSSYRLYDLVLSETIYRLVKPNSICVDIGANIGVFTSLMSFRGGTVHSFEPHPVLFDMLKKNCSQLKSVVLHKLAISREKGTFDLYIPATFGSNEGVASLEPMEKSTKISVATSTLDLMFQDQTIDLLKIDVEGHEKEVLYGAKKLLSNQRIKNIVFEEFGGGGAETILKLKSYGYTLYRLEKGFFNLKLLNPTDGDKIPLWEPPNFLATLSKPDWKRKIQWEIL